MPEPMQPFLISEASSRLIDQYPDAKTLFFASKEMSNLEREGLIRLWLTEGIPFAFHNCPIIYEAIRSWLANNINVHPKEITIIGSGRIGYSLESSSKYGLQFGPHSDLDFSVISKILFLDMSDSFSKWKQDFSEGKIRPRHPQENKFWAENSNLVPNNIARGFIDANKVPYFNIYPIAAKMGQTLWMLNEKLKVTPKAPQVRKSHLRIYRDWSAFMQQMGRNLSYTIRFLKSTPAKSF